MLFPSWNRKVSWRKMSFCRFPLKHCNLPIKWKVANFCTACQILNGGVKPNSRSSSSDKFLLWYTGNVFNRKTSIYCLWCWWDRKRFCFCFQSVSHQIYGSADLHFHIRMAEISYLRFHSELFHKVLLVKPGRAIFKECPHEVTWCDVIVQVVR